MDFEGRRQESHGNFGSMDSLPNQIRMKIFSLLLVRDGEILSLDAKFKDQQDFLPLKSIWKSYECKNRADDLFLHPLLRVSSQVRWDALTIIVSMNRFSTQESRRLLLFLRYLGPLGRKHLQELEIDLLPWNWALEPRDSKIEYLLQEAIGLLATCSSLRDLTIHIPPIWALCTEVNVESIWTTEDLIRMPVFSALASLRGIEQVHAEWTDYETDWYEDHGFTFFRDRLCDHSVNEAHTLLETIKTWLEKSISGPRREELIETKPKQEQICNEEGIFPFLSLPRELRDKIYSCMLTSPTQLRLLGANLESEYEEQSELYPLSLYSRTREFMQNPLLFANRQLRVEAQHTLYSTNTFKLGSLSRLSIFFSHLGPTLRGQLTSLILCISHGSALDEIEPAEDIFDQLAACTKLAHLSLYLDLNFLSAPATTDDTVSLLPKDQIYKHDIIEKLSRLRGLKTAEIIWIPYFASPGTRYPAELSETLSALNKWMCGQMQTPVHE